MGRVDAPPPVSISAALRILSTGTPVARSAPSNVKSGVENRYSVSSSKVRPNMRRRHFSSVSMAARLAVCSAMNSASSQPWSMISRTIAL